VCNDLNDMADGHYSLSCACPALAIPRPLSLAVCWPSIPTTSGLLPRCPLAAR
jgi:hypothetical protein